MDVAAHAPSPIPGNRSSQLAVMGRSAPAMYRSPVRAAMLAGLVAGASAAAAWSLSVSLAPPGATFAVVRSPSSVTTPGSTIAAAWSSQATSFLTTNQPSPVEGPWPAVPNGSRRSAQSTHE
jgi:hypothetical protein